ncbi:MAG: hypothetical protein E4H00_10945, partial [Myxococcales bacterium]
MLDLISGVAVLALMRLLWSATDFWPVVLGIWAALLIVSAVGLLAGTAWGRTAARVAAFYQLGFLLVLITGILTSAAYLWGVYGQIGVGISVALLIILAVLFEVVGLLPLLKLRRIGVTARSSTGRHGGRWPAAGAALLAGVFAYGAVVHARASLDLAEPIPPEGRAAMSQYLMAAITPGS